MKDDLQEWRLDEDWCLEGMNGGVLYNFQHVYKWLSERPWDKWFQVLIHPTPLSIKLNYRFVPLIAFAF